MSREPAAPRSGAAQPGAARSGAADVVVTGLTLFALFFGAGNLIFPPVLGASAGHHLASVVAGFCLTGVLMPLVAVVAVSTSGEGILGLARRVGPRFGLLMPAAVYLSIGPLYAVPRVATVSYELATRPVLALVGLPTGRATLAAHAAVFIGVSLWLGLHPTRMVERVGRLLTPALLVLLAVLCAVVVITRPVLDRPAQPGYDQAPFTTGLTQGYLTMDVLAATVFGIVVIQSLRSRGRSTTSSVVRGTLGAGVLAAVLLAAVYVGLAVLGARTPADDVTDGTALLRTAAADALGPAGVLVVAGIVLLACLTTATGLLSSFAAYAHTALPAVSTRAWLAGSAVVALALANLGLTAVLAVIAPLTLLLYPLAITLVVATFVDAVAPGHLRWAYVWPVTVAGLGGLVSAASACGLDAVSQWLARTGAWNDSTGWMVPTLVALVAGCVADAVAGRWSAPAPDVSDAQEEVSRIAAEGFGHREA